MSHRATNWAIQQRGLSPVSKLVLWHLCDRHNPDYGCFPSQDQLAADVEISRASLNVHLEKLEAVGLIRRERRHEEGTHKRKSTRYLLGFEDDFGAEPCPDSGHGNGQKPCPDFGESHVQNLDTNLVREPVTKNACDARARRDPEPPCLGACGEGLSPASRAEIGATKAVIAMPAESAKDAGEADAGPTAVPGKASAMPSDNASDPPAPVALIAAWINSGRYVPPCAVSTSMRASLLAAGLVTEAELRARQIF